MSDHTTHPTHAAIDWPAPNPTRLADVDLSLDCETHGHVFGLFSPGGSTRPCMRYGCPWVDAYDPDDFVTGDGDLYDLDDPDRDELGYYGIGLGADAYVLRNLAWERAHA